MESNLVIYPVHMDSILEDLAIWRQERGLTRENQLTGYNANICSELEEFYRAKTIEEEIDALCDIAVFSINILDSDTDSRELCYLVQMYVEKPDEVTLTFDLTAKGKVVSPARNLAKVLAAVYKKGYSPYIAMGETIKEISSRTGAYNAEVGKWIKDTSEEAKAKWYTANYELAKY